MTWRAVRVFTCAAYLTLFYSVAAAESIWPGETQADAGAIVEAPIELTAAAPWAEPDGGCNCCACDQCQAKAKQADLNKAVAAAYAPVFYNNNFNYLCDDAYSDWHLGENLKRLCVGDNVILDIGGQYRARYHNEHNHRSFGLTGNDDEFLLHRTRLYFNAEIGERVRVFAEYLDAESNYEDLPPRVIEVNRSDMQNLFADVMLSDSCCGELWLRAGRQELIYGNQRLISPLDWANTRRTFEGYKTFYKGEKWDVDAFYVRPMTIDPHNFDSPDYDQEFFGVYSTWKAVKNRTYDLYFLGYNNERATNDFQFGTLGGRLQASEGPLLWEFESAVQFGDNTDGSNHSAGFATLGLGRKWDAHAWKPTLWVYYDWAAGGDVLGARQGFDHLFPLSHKYLGFMDLFGRSNIESPNVQLTVKPTDKLTLLAWYYYLFLENKRDTPYNVNMTPFNPGNAPASAELGHEIDLVVTYALTPRQELLLGYSHFFTGRYYELTAGAPTDSDADFFYSHYQVNF